MAVIHVTDRKGRQRTIDGKVGATLMENLRDNDLDIEAACGGCCSCATCHIYIGDAWMAKTGQRSEDETELVSQTEAYDPHSSRLSCQIKFTDAFDGITVTVAPAE